MPILQVVSLLLFLFIDDGDFASCVFVILLMMILKVLLCPCYSHLATSDATHPGELTHVATLLPLNQEQE